MAGQYETSTDMQLICGCPVPAKPKPKKESVVELIPRAASGVVKAIFNKKMDRQR